MYYCQIVSQGNFLPALIFSIYKIAFSALIEFLNVLIAATFCCPGEIPYFSNISILDKPRLFYVATAS